MTTALCNAVVILASFVKAASDCRRNASKARKMTYSAMVREVAK